VKGEAGPQGKPGVQGEAGPRGEQGPPGQLPSIEQVMPWLHLIFDAWEDHRRMREEAEQREAATQAALADEHLDSDAEGDDDERREKKKKKKDKK
jgi:hypothetical protein